MSTKSRLQANKIQTSNRQNPNLNRTKSGLQTDKNRTETKIKPDFSLAEESLNGKIEKC
jgi:hypothetical protein